MPQSIDQSSYKREVLACYLEHYGLIELYRTDPIIKATLDSYLASDEDDFVNAITQCVKNLAASRAEMQEMLRRYLDNTGTPTILQIPDASQRRRI